MGNIQVCEQKDFNPGALLGNFERSINLKNDVLGVLYLFLIFLFVFIILGVIAGLVYYFFFMKKKPRKIRKGASTKSKFPSINLSFSGKEKIETNMKLKYSLILDQDRKECLIKLHNAEQLATFSGDLPKAYVFLALRNIRDESATLKHGKRTRTIDLEENPVWDEEFMYKLENIDDEELRFLVYHESSCGRDELLGVYDQDLHDLKPGSKTMQVNLLEPLIDQTSFGEIMIVLKLDLNNSQIHVTLLEAKNLILKEKEMPEFFVSVTTHIKKKRLQNLKTSIRKNTTEPNFSETIIFPIKESKLSIVNVTCSLKYKYNGKNGCVGRVTFGANVNNSMAKKHWLTLIENPEKAIGMWHKLRRISMDDE